MKPRAFVWAVSLLLVSCSDYTPPAAYSHAQDKLLAAVPLAILDQDLQPCFRTINGKPGRLSDADCYRFRAPQHMRGVAITGFEAGLFYAGWTRRPPTELQTNLRLQLDPRSLASDPMKAARRKCTGGCTVYLDFIGRQTAVQGSYGHMGLGKNIVIVDRILAAKVLD